ncbi:hypothetical protein [Treponema pectinovorum]|uniref:hypothetical protein n=1 Tax=Treponema pectinovorum TaxID=164 RepID=UPI0011C6EB50|nr:hypothetical protein [Treponema pectinovorum]
MKVKEVINQFKDQYDYVEIFVGEDLQSKSCDFYNPEKGYGDCKKGQEERLNSYCIDYDAKKFELMTFDRYKETILATLNTSPEDYGYKENDKILCILIDKKSIYHGEEFADNVVLNSELINNGRNKKN